MRSGRPLAAVLLLAAPAGGRELSGTLELRTALKSTLLLSHAPDDPALFPEQDGGASLWRLRLELLGRPGQAATFGFSWEHRIRIASQGEGSAAAGILPPESGAPYRLRQLDWGVAEAAGYSWRNEIDRAFLALHLGRAEVTLGRQAVGWGRGAIFSAIDLFAPFSPLEADREWRRGVDALRADLKLSDRFSLDAVAAFGERLDDSAFAARLRGYAADLDGELLVGRRGTDLVAGATASAPLGDAEVHAELALFRAADPLPAGGELGDSRLAVKAVAGASYRFDVGSGLLLVAEYHHSGFGARNAAAISALLLDPRFASRVSRGDTQILGRDAAALLASIELAPDLALSALALGSPADASGVLSPSMTITIGQSLSLLATGYLTFGRAPRGTTLRSEYGATPMGALLQLRLYD